MAKDRAEQRKAAPSSDAGAPASFSYRFRRLTTPYLLAILSALLLTLAFPPLEFSWVAYLALVPLLLMASATRSPRAVFRAAWVGGVVFFGVNAHWLLPITVAGWTVAVVYLGLYWALFAWLVRRLREEPRVPLTIAAPVLWVGLEWFRGWFVTGLPWLFVGHTQYENLVLIQTADLVGAYGPSFLVVMTAGLAADLLTRPLVVRDLVDAAGGALADKPPVAPGEGDRALAGKPPVAPGGAGRRVSRLVWGMVALTAAAWAATVAYGSWRLRQGPDVMHPGPVVAIVQTCVPQAVKQEARHGDEDVGKGMMETQVRLTHQALADLKTAGERADLIVWPETMVPGIMNRRFLEDDLAAKIENARLLEVFRFFQEESRNYWFQIRLLSAEAEAPILFGASAAQIESVVRLPGDRFMTTGPRWNTAFLMTPDCKEFAVAHEYSKVHLVPFGETVPFKDSWPWLREQLMALSPYDFDYTVEPGSRGQEPFEIRYRAPTATTVEAPHPRPLSPQGEGSPPAPGGPSREPRATSQGNGGTLTPAPSPASGRGEVAGPVSPGGPSPLRERVAEGRVRGSGEPGGAERIARFQVAICYEDAMAYRIREMVRPTPPGRRKDIDFLVNISNDGWFNGSIELDQHLNLCVFRAVENRIPIVRSVNTGISAIIRSDGRIEKVVADAAGKRRYVEGETHGRLMLDDRRAPYTGAGDVLAIGCLVGTAAVPVWLAGARLRRARRKAAPQGKAEDP